MLIRFGVENHLSIDRYQEISFVASSLKDQNSDTIKVEGFRHRLLPLLAIYGANASGKTNTLSAIAFMRNIILNSHTKGTVGSKIPRKPFALIENSKETFTKMDCDFLIDGVRYHYGFSWNDHRIVEEWLHAYPNKQRQVWFHRNSVAGPIKFGEHFQGKNRVIEALTRENSLFLSAAAQNNHPLASVIYTYFHDKFIVYQELSNNVSVQDMIFNYINNPEIGEKFKKIVKHADFGIASLEVKLTEFPNLVEMIKKSKTDDEFIIDFSRFLEKHENHIQIPQESKSIQIGHRGGDNNIYNLPLEDESKGTIEFLRISGPVLDAITNGKILIFDEIDTSLHPLLSLKIISMFAKIGINAGRGQLMFTTHDTNILSSGIFRRDQIWFTEKSKEGRTYVYPLTDISVRKTENLAKSYLSGKLGAIPFLREMDNF